MKKILFILNPKAGHGLNRHIEEKIEEVFHGSDFSIEKVFTQYSGHATELSRNASAKNYYAAIAVGGDGTVNEVAAGLVNSNTAAGIIPAGSGNGFSNFLKIPHPIEKALLIIKNGKLKTIDSFTVNGRFGINVAGFGFDAFVAEQFANAGKRGFITYIKLVMKSYFGFAEKEYEIEMDGVVFNRKAFLIEAANGAEFGNHAVIAAPALADDGWLDLVILRKNNLFNLPATLFRIFAGAKLHPTIAEYHRGKNIIIRSERPMYMHIDGEATGQDVKAEIKILPGSIRVIAGTS
jgi:YegS/Rv2252/BmrU family lipid kinase